MFSPDLQVVEIKYKSANLRFICCTLAFVIFFAIGCFFPPAFLLCPFVGYGAYQANGVMKGIRELLASKDIIADLWVDHIYGRITLPPR